MISKPFESYSQNGEDVVLWRGLRHIVRGRYIDVGANHPSEDSVTMAFYSRGWTGITIEPDPEFSALQRRDRPRDRQVQAAITAKDHDTVTLHVVDGTGLSTLDDTFARMHSGAGYQSHDITVPTRRLDAILEEAGWAGEEIHFMSVDTEGSEREVLESIDLGVWRPWVLVIEATTPNSTEPTRQSWEQMVIDAGYEFCLFDGLSCFYASSEHVDELRQRLTYPACALDNYTSLATRKLSGLIETIQARLDGAEVLVAERTAEVRTLVEQLARWRTQATTRWATAVATKIAAAEYRQELEKLRQDQEELLHIHQQVVEDASHVLADLRAQVDELHDSRSWRLTKPVRGAQRHRQAGTRRGLTQVIDPATVEAALLQRLNTAYKTLVPSCAEQSVGSGAADLLVRLVLAVQSDPSPERMWLLCTAAFGAFPTPEDVIAGVRFFQLAPTEEGMLWLLDRALVTDFNTAGRSEMRVVSECVVVDVDHSACQDLHTGIQQVVRRTVPIWSRDYDLLPVAWSQEKTGWRTLSGSENRRVLHWGSSGYQADDDTPPVLVAPWRTVVVLIETPPAGACERLAALAQYSGNTLVSVGYDCVPALSAHLVPLEEPQRFARYLTVIKHARRVAGISRSASTEFRGFASTLEAQGLAGPLVVDCPGPTDPAVASDDGVHSRVGNIAKKSPLVLCVSSLEPRKNHSALLYAAERLWREGLDFQLLFIAGSGWGEEVPRRIAQLQAAGRSISLRRAVNDSELASAYRAARFTVLASLHEGYGLPVAESLALGTPVITGKFGSTEEIGRDGGALLIDPRDDEALVDAMRRLLTDDGLLNELRVQIRGRTPRTWEQYAGDLWECLVTPELERARRVS